MMMPFSIYLAEAIRSRIQDALFDMLSRRRSVWFG